MRSKLNVIGVSLLLGLSSIFVQSCSSKANNTDKEEIAEEKACCTKTIEETSATAYYFHATRRCATCQAVEKVSKEYIEANYAEKVTFISINREEDQNSELVEKYEIAGQTLLLVFGDEVVNLTTQAFMNARTNPEKLEELIKTTIDERIK
ncbi:nitrophenyl compound nitroreductase subunit ArsF family protein [Bacteroidota bacterium]